MEGPAPGTGAPARLLVVSGPGGVGKGTVVAELLRRRPDVTLSVSATTRSPRPGEAPGEDYHFLSEGDFARLVDEGGFLEWVEFDERRYGTPWSSVREARERGGVVALEIDVQGAKQVQAAFPDAVLVFLAPPSEEALLERLRGRGERDEVISRRMAIARWELAQAPEFDHVVVNDDIDAAVSALDRILEQMPAT